MELGKKLLQARQEAGLSQRQLCDGIVTRNMLSQIEHGSAKPSMDTLRALAARLGKPLSWFLEEDALSSPNQAAMEQARLAWQAQDLPAIQSALAQYRSPDLIFDGEKNLLTILALLGLAEKSLAGGMAPYARELLEQAQSVSKHTLYYTPELERKRLLLLARTEPRKKGEVCQLLPSLDAELLLRAEAALEAKQPSRAMALLDAMEGRDVHWQLLKGRGCLEMGNYREAAQYLHGAENTFPRETARLLEICYRELEDYKQAYFYACKQK